MSELTEKDLLLRALAEPRFRLIFIPFTHYNTVRYVKQLLTENFPDRTAQEIDLEQQTVATIIPRLEGLKDGILYFDNFQILLKSEHLRTYLNQRRDWLAARPVAYVAFVNNGENMPAISKGIKDLYSFRTLVLYDLEKEAGTTSQSRVIKPLTTDQSTWGVKAVDLEIKVSDLFENWEQKLEQKDDVSLMTLLMDDLMASIAKHPSIKWRGWMMQQIEAKFNEVFASETPLHASAILQYYIGLTNLHGARYDQAEIHIRRAIKLEPAESKYLIPLSQILDRTGRSEESLSILESYLNSPDAEKDQIMLASVLNNIGHAWSSKGDYETAIAYYKNALAIWELSSEQTGVATILNNIGSALSHQGDADKAIDYFDRALNLDLELLGEDHPNTAGDLNNLGEYWRLKGDYDKAITYYERALSSAKKTLGNDHPNVAIALNNIGLAWKNKGDNEKAIDFYEKALQIDTKLLNKENPNFALRFFNLGVAWMSKGEYNMAIDYFEKALTIWHKAFPSGHPFIETLNDSLAEAKAAKANS